jgi:arylsulfatase A-like enzyme
MARIEYAARALAEVLVPQVNPAVITFWITLPDGVHHRHGLGSPEARQAIRGVDAVFGTLVERLGGADLNVIVTADHGYATVSGHVDVAAELVRAGLKHAPDSTEIVTCADGGACLIYAEPSVDLERVAAFLLGQEWTGALFSRDDLPGTLPLAAVNCAGPNAPALLLGMAWQDAPNAHGIIGLSWGQGGIAVGAGDHGGISPFEMRNTLLLAGPVFREGGASAQPCGIVDIAPTMLHGLGIAPPAVWDGRVLTEALRDGDPPSTMDEQIEMPFQGGRQVLTLARAGAVSYPSRVDMVRDN